MKTVKVTRGPVAYKWVVLINTTIAVLMAGVDNSIITIAIPDITRALQASVVEMMWVLMGYSLVVAALLLPVSRLADMKGRVKLYNLGFAVFTVGSALSGFSQSGTQLMLARLVQGVGAALLYANCIALVTDAFPSSQRGFALGIVQMAAISGFILGIALGGIITELLGWRYIFFINLPFGAIAGVWGFLKLHEMVDPERTGRFDFVGMLTIALGIPSILAGLTFVVMGRAGDPITAGLFVLGIILLIGFVLNELHHAQPLMDLSLFRNRLFWSGNTSMFLNALARGSTMFIMSWYFQAILGDSPLVAGLKMLPLACTMMLFAPVAGRLCDLWGARWLSAFGLGLTLAAQVWIITFPVSVPYLTLGIALAVLGIGNALFNLPNVSSVMGVVPANRRGVTAGMRTLLYNCGQTAAIAMAMVILSAVMSYQLLAGLFTGGAAGGQSLNGVEFMNGLQQIFLVSSVLTALAIVCAILPGTENRLEQPPAQEADDSAQHSSLRMDDPAPVRTPGRF